MARRVVGGFQPLGTNRSGPGGAGGMRADGGGHGLRGRSEVGELVRMRSRLHASAADQAEPEACGPMAVKPLRCASTRGWPRAQMKRTAAMVSEAVRRSASWSGCGVNGEGGEPWPEGSSAASNPWEQMKRTAAMVSEAVRRCVRR